MLRSLITRTITPTIRTMSTATATAPTVMTAITSHHQYITDGIPSASSLKSNPLEQFTSWFDEAVDSKIVPEPEAVAVSTVSNKGIPSTRFVLLKKVDDKGFVFYTNYESRKGQELFNEQGEGGYASMAFYWREQHRSVRIVGKVEKVSSEETKEYFDSRGVGSRIGAWASRQSRVLTGREELEEQVKEIEKKFGVSEESGDASGVAVGGESKKVEVKSGGDVIIPAPSYWGGVRLIPFEFEFWMGRESRLHDRFRYIREEGSDGEWTVDRLSP